MKLTNQIANAIMQEKVFNIFENNLVFEQKTQKNRKSI